MIFFPMILFELSFNEWTFIFLIYANKCVTKRRKIIALAFKGT